jgi:phosphoribosylanthranilate isomerase
MTYVKICGCMSEADVLAAAEAGPDFVGFVFAPSPRRISPEAVRRMSMLLGAPLNEVPLPQKGGDADSWGVQALEKLLGRKRPLTVGVFEDQPVEEVNAVAAAAAVDLVQLSGREPWRDCALVERWVVKAIDTDDPVSNAGLVDAFADRQGPVIWLLDSSRGHGKRADWGLAAEISCRLPLILAGGLTPDNVAEAVRVVRPWGVDVSSGVETAGVKDAAKIRAFVAAAKGA